MRGARGQSYSQFLLCCSAAAGLIGCGVEAESTPSAESPSAAPSVPGTPQAAAGTACMGAQPAGPWLNQAFGAQTGKVGIDFSATPSAAAIDAVVGFSSVAAAQFADLAAAIRFNPDGQIDVRAGSAYQSDLAIAYTAGTTYRFHIDLDVTAHTYSVQVASGQSAASAIAASYGFRTEQGSVSQLTNLAVKVDSTAGGLQVCDLQVTPASVASCAQAAAGAGFHNTSFGQPGDAVVTFEAQVTPSSVLDGVVGLSPSGATSFNDIATAVRFSPDGVIDARNGDTYSADVAVKYTPGETRRIRIVADVGTRTFSAFVASADGQSSVEIAHHYAFRASAKQNWLGDITTVVDSPSGTLALCNPQPQISVGVRSLREANFDVAPLPGLNDQVILATATTTQSIGLGGNVVAQLAVGGRVAVDPNSNVYLARIADGNLVVEAYTTALAARWSHSFALGAGQQIVAIGADAASVVVATGPTAGGVTLAKRYLTDGTETTAQAVTGDIAAISPAGLVLGSSDGTTVALRKFALGDATPTWERSFQNSARISALAISTSGIVAFGGSFSGPISFGGATVSPGTGQPTYVATLTETGAAGFVVQQPFLGHIAGIAVNAGLVAISSPGNETNLDDSNGDVVRGENEHNPFNFTPSIGGQVVIGGSGLVYWNFQSTWPATGSSYPYLISLDPGD